MSKYSIAIQTPYAVELKTLNLNQVKHIIHINCHKIPLLILLFIQNKLTTVLNAKVKQSSAQTGAQKSLTSVSTTGVLMKTTVTSLYNSRNIMAELNQK